ncbi:hypothetical protein Q8O96_05850 [Pseudomonas sp. LPH60]|uniref:hypothetical protein n=1 Tax=Pseudomonas sp. LPH60 TaxID=3065906 RepID=UPI00273C0578|nr:hypothetical protein [Pseudomonas sp. LPH60]MDP4568562.1 hypothetical protein [Pseudomonas sp. LPH60]
MAGSLKNPKQTNNQLFLKDIFQKKARGTIVVMHRQMLIHNNTTGDLAMPSARLAPPLPYPSALDERSLRNLARLG